MGPTIRNSVKALRSRKEMTQEELAEALGVSRQTVIAIEKNKYLPSLPLAFKIAETFNQPIEEIFYTK